MLKLIYPKEEHKNVWEDIRKEWGAKGEDVTPYAQFYRQDSFDVFLQKTEESHNNVNLGNYVPATTYFIMEDQQDRILGAVNIRHWLNEDLI